MLGDRKVETSDCGGLDSGDFGACQARPEGGESFFVSEEPYVWPKLVNKPFVMRAIKDVIDKSVDNIAGIGASIDYESGYRDALSYFATELILMVQAETADNG